MNRLTNRRITMGSTLIVLAVLFVAIIVVSNILLRGARVDLTENKLYTLSEGTLQVVSEIQEPLNLYFFFSDRATQNVPMIRNYALRVREMLEEIQAKSNDNIRLTIIDPLPFSEEEDRATNFGLQAIPVGGSGEKVFMGLAGTNATDGQMIIPFFQPDKESFLEYDIAKMIHALNTTTKPVIGLLTSLNMTAEMNPETHQMKAPWAIYQTLDELFDIRTLDAQTTTQIDDDVKTLLVVHPKDFTEDALYAIDQFVLRGGNLIAFFDPEAEQDVAGVDPNNPTASVFAKKSSDMPQLFKSWGVVYDASKILLDQNHALQVQNQMGAPIRHLAILGFHQQDMNQDDVISAQLSSINFSTAGAFTMEKNTSLTLTPLIQSSQDAMLKDAQSVKFVSDPNQLFKDFIASDETYVLAGRLTGKPKTAFPERTDKGHLSEANKNVNILLVADTDILSDRLWVQVQRFFGQQIMNAFANNGDFATNAVDNMTGSSALISVRSRAVAARPFTTVEALRRNADDRYRVKEQELNEELQDTERKLNDLQRNKENAESALILSAEQKLELERFQQEKIRIRKELRSVRRQLDASIESLGTTLKLVNIVIAPLLLTMFAWLLTRWRRQSASR